MRRLLAVALTSSTVASSSHSKYLEDFNTYDLDGNKVIDPQEIRTVHQGELSEEDLHSFWARMDTKHNGFFTLQEFIDSALRQDRVYAYFFCVPHLHAFQVMRAGLILAAVCAVRAIPEAEIEGYSEEPELTPEMMEAQARDDFNTMDADKNGSLTKEEIMEYLDDESADGEVEDFMGRADTDGDTEISFDEYFAFVMELFAQYAQQEQGGFDDFDFGDLEGFDSFEGLDDLDDLDDPDDLEPSGEHGEEL